MLGREVQYGSAVQLDGLLCGVVHNALYVCDDGGKDSASRAKKQVNLDFFRGAAYLLCCEAAIKTQNVFLIVQVLTADADN